MAGSSAQQEQGKKTWKVRLQVAVTNLSIAEMELMNLALVHSFGCCLDMG